jgi:hypothetical protein
MAHRPVPIPQHHRERLAELARRSGISAAARAAGIGRMAALSAIALGEGTKGTAAILELTFEHGEGAPSTGAGGAR